MYNSVLVCFLKFNSLCENEGLVREVRCRMYGAKMFNLHTTVYLLYNEGVLTHL